MSSQRNNKDSFIATYEVPGTVRNALCVFIYEYLHSADELNNSPKVLMGSASAEL